MTKLKSVTGSKQVLLLDSWSFHFWNGIKYNYPLCCVLWYCNVVTNQGLQENSLFERLYREVYENYRITEKSCKFEDYNRCPDCLERRMITID